MDPVAGVRTAVLGTCCALLTVGGHVAGGGHPPSVAALAAVGLLSLCLAAVGARTRWTPGSLVAILTGCQLGCHELLGAVAPAGHAAHAGHAEPARGEAMVVGHLLAATLCGVLLTRADASWSLLLAVVQRVAAAMRLRTPYAGYGLVPIHPPAPTAAPETCGGPVLLTHTVSRRGPPPSLALDPLR